MEKISIPEIPKPVRVITGDQYLLQETMYNFFESTREYLIKEKNASQMRFIIKSNNLYRNTELSGATPLDDRVTMLLYQDTPVAVVTETRSEFNNVQYCFFLNLDISVDH